MPSSACWRYGSGNIRGACSRYSRPCSMWSPARSPIRASSTLRACVRWRAGCRRRSRCRSGCSLMTRWTPLRSASSARMDRPFENTYWVLPGIVLAGEYPAGGTQAETGARLQRLFDAGIDFFLDLTEAGERPEYQSRLPSHVDYLRCAIRDASVPADPAHMRAIQAHLQTAVAVGRRVYVHCRAGVGRTATVIGCYLAEQGLDGPAALSQLNRLWQSCARAVTWPVVPQTREQAEFIRRCPGHRQPLAPSAGLSALRALRGRYLGCLLGLAVGDALGAATQYRRPASFAPVGDLVGGGPFDLARGSWSDDTAMALCLAESLLERQGCEPDDQLLRYNR